MTRRQAIAALAVALTLAPVAPAQAHHGYAGPVRLYLETVRLETEGQGWRLHAGVNDSGTGKPATGFVVDASGSGPRGAAFGPVHLIDLEGNGRYRAALGALPAGDWSLTVNVTDAPGSDERAVPVTRTWRLPVASGRSLELIGRRTTLDEHAAPSSSGSGTIAPVLAIAGLAILLVVACHGRKNQFKTVRKGADCSGVSEKGKPVARRGRKATGPTGSAGLPNDRSRQCAGKGGPGVHRAGR